MRKQICLIIMAMVLLAGAALAAGADTLGVDWKTYKKDRVDFWSAKTVYPQFKSSDELVKFANPIISKAAIKAQDDFIYLANGYTAIRTEDDVYKYWSKATISLAKPRIISLYFTRVEYTGGKYTSTIYEPFNFAFINGNPVRFKLKDLFLPGVDAHKVVSDLAIEEIKKDKNQTSTLKSLTPEQMEVFNLTLGALQILIPPAAGSKDSQGTAINIPNSALRDKLDPNGPVRELIYFATK